MKRFILATAAVAAIGAAVAIPVLADANHGAGEQRFGAWAGQMGQMGAGAMMDGDMGQMMGMMQMMQGHQGGMVGHGFAGPGGMGHMQGAFDADNDGTVTPDELRAGLLEALSTYDADGNGMLSLDEFETMHTAHIREMTVDRFQVLDADGDGQVTAEEMAAPADRMQRRAANTPQGMPMMDGNNAQGTMGDN